jgi:Retroviral aspartyl protease
LRARVSANQYSDEEYYLLGFLSGLKDEISDVVLLYNPTSLKQAYKLARHVECSLDSHNKMLKPLVRHYPQQSSFSKNFKPKEDKSASISFDSPNTNDHSSTKALTLDQKRALGLCFRCGDKFTPGHKCKHRGLHLMEGEEFSDSNDLTSVDDLAPPASKFSEENSALIIMCTSNSSSKHNTFKFKGQIDHIAIITLVDSGSTHSFTNPDIVHNLSIPTSLSPPLMVTTASGSHLSTTTICTALTFQLQDIFFTGDFQVLHVAGIDLILGMDWLHAHSPIEMNCDTSSLSLYLKGKKVTLQFQPVTTEFLMCEYDVILSKQYQQGNQVFVAHLFYLDISFAPTVTSIDPTSP